MGTCSRICHSNGFPHSSAGKESACNSGDPSLIPGSGRYPGEGIGYSVFLGFPCGSVGKESTYNEGDLGLIPGLGRSPGEGKGYPLQYSGLENSMDSVVHGVTKSQIWLSDFHFLVIKKWIQNEILHKITKPKVENIFKNNFIYLFIQFWLYWVFIATWAFSSCSEQASHCSGFSLRTQALGHVGFSSCDPQALSTASVVLAHGLSCAEVCGIFPDQGSNTCLLHWPGRVFTTEPLGKPEIILICLCSSRWNKVQKRNGRWNLVMIKWCLSMLVSFSVKNDRLTQQRGTRQSSRILWPLGLEQGFALRCHHLRMFTLD